MPRPSLTAIQIRRQLVLVELMSCPMPRPMTNHYQVGCWLYTVTYTLSHSSTRWSRDTSTEAATLVTCRTQNQIQAVYTDASNSHWVCTTVLGSLCAISCWIQSSTRSEVCQHCWLHHYRSLVVPEKWHVITDTLIVTLLTYSVVTIATEPASIDYDRSFEKIVMSIWCYTGMWTDNFLISAN